MYICKTSNTNQILLVESSSCISELLVSKSNIGFEKRRLSCCSFRVQFNLMLLKLEPLGPIGGEAIVQKRRDVVPNVYIKGGNTRTH